MNAVAVETQITLGFESAGMLMTPAEFDEITEYDDCYRYQLIHGVLVVNPIPSEAEANPNEELGHWLRTYKDQHPQGSALDATLPERYVRLPTSRRRADRVVWAGLGRRPEPRADVPTIVIEFVSSGRRSWRRDYVDKRQEYMELGVSEYWVIDRFQRTMTVWSKPQTGQQERVIQEGQLYSIDLLPGFELPLARLLSAADGW